jgi:hypothetical protein
VGSVEWIIQQASVFIELRIVKTIHFLHVFHKRILSRFNSTHHVKFLFGIDVHRFLFTPASHSVERWHQILVKVPMSPAIFDWVQSFIEFAIIKSEILLFVHNSIEPNLVLSWRFGDRCIVLEEFILVFLHEVIVYGIKFEFSEVWISCSVTPFFEWCAISSFILILVVGLF